MLVMYNRIGDALGHELREAACPEATDPPLPPLLLVEHVVGANMLLVVRDGNHDRCRHVICRTLAGRRRACVWAPGRPWAYLNTRNVSFAACARNDS
jgi:hypothetical protein